jgi:dihydrofolate reductase
MRRFKLQTQVSLDGYMCGPNGEMDFLTVPWTEDLGDYVTALYDGVDCMVLGRKLAEGFIPHWAARPAHEPDSSIDTMNNTPKVVVSNSLTESPWENTVVAGGDLTETIGDPKGRPGGDIIAFGGATLVQGLTANALADDVYLFVNPTARGAGRPVFPMTGANQAYRLVESRGFDCGVTVLHLQPESA